MVSFCSKVSTGPLVAWMLTVCFLFQLQVPLTYFFHSDVLALHITTQNARVIIRKPNMTHSTVEFFQALPTATTTTIAPTVGKLTIQLPSHPPLHWQEGCQPWLSPVLGYPHHQVFDLLLLNLNNFSGTPTGAELPLPPSLVPLDLPLTPSQLQTGILPILVPFFSMLIGWTSTT